VVATAVAAVVFLPGDLAKAIVATLVAAGVHRGHPVPPPARRERTDRTVTQTIFGGDDAQLPDPQDARSVVAEKDAEAQEELARLQRVAELSREQRGADDPGTLRARADIAMFLWQMGRTDEAIEIEEELVTDSTRVLGAEHPEVLTARANLASSYWTAGRADEAIEIEEAVLADAERILGADSLGTLTARANLAFSYSTAGRKQDAVEVQRQVVADRERVLEADDPDTLDARANLASACWNADLIDEAIETEERILK
jgi:tetratricopeptide (TPR) repeat protein